MANTFRLCVTTPKKVKYEGDAELVIMRCITGDMGIMANHEPTSAILDDGVLRIINDKDERRMAVFGGIAQVKDNLVTILANDAQWAEEIDVALAEAQREQLLREMQDSADDLTIARDQILMRRTLVQIEVSTFPLVGGSAGAAHGSGAAHSNSTGGSGGHTNGSGGNSAKHEESKDR